MLTMRTYAALSVLIGGLGTAAAAESRLYMSYIKEQKSSELEYILLNPPKEHLRQQRLANFRPSAYAKLNLLQQQILLRMDCYNGNNLPQDQARLVRGYRVEELKNWSGKIALCIQPHKQAASRNQAFLALEKLARMQASPLQAREELQYMYDALMIREQSLLALRQYLATPFEAVQGALQKHCFSEFNLYVLSHGSSRYLLYSIEYSGSNLAADCKGLFATEDFQHWLEELNKLLVNPLSEQSWLLSAQNALGTAEP